MNDDRNLIFSTQSIIELGILVLMVLGLGVLESSNTIFSIPVLITILLSAGYLIIYSSFYPSIKAHQRNNRFKLVLALNILIGWSLLGWYVALGFALWRKK